MKKMKPQITQITQIFLFFLCVLSCNFVADFLIIFTAVLHDTSLTRKPMKLIKRFCGGVQGGQFFQKAPHLAAGGKSNPTS